MKFTALQLGSSQCRPGSSRAADLHARATAKSLGATAGAEIRTGAPPGIWTASCSPRSRFSCVNTTLHMTPEQCNAVRRKQRALVLPKYKSAERKLAEVVAELGIDCNGGAAVVELLDGSAPRRCCRRHPNHRNQGEAARRCASAARLDSPTSTSATGADRARASDASVGSEQLLQVRARRRQR